MENITPVNRRKVESWKWFKVGDTVIFKEEVYIILSIFEEFDNPTNAWAGHHSARFNIAEMDSEKIRYNVDWTRVTKAIL